MNSFSLNSHSFYFFKATSDTEGFERMVVKNGEQQTVYSRSLSGTHTSINIDNNTLFIVENPLDSYEQELTIRLSNPGACQQMDIQGFGFIMIEDVRAGLIKHTFDLTATQVDINYTALANTGEVIIRSTNQSAYSYTEGPCG